MYVVSIATDNYNYDILGQMFVDYNIGIKSVMWVQYVQADSLY